MNWCCALDIITPNRFLLLDRFLRFILLFHELNPLRFLNFLRCPYALAVIVPTGPANSDQHRFEQYNAFQKVGAWISKEKNRAFLGLILSTS